MQRTFWFSIITVLCAVVGYYSYFFIMPSVEINNQSGQLLTRAEINLPKSNLVFDNIKPAQSLRIHHSNDQADGAYIYHIKLSSGEQVEGRCGAISSDQYMKVQTITINNDHQVSCTD
ncbi:hypothetical protein [Shewanella youngdeokensis]|uniref:Uncharacterized protein n=1 Tax=Shewanella youngdeokensis TaxID=2999068 RepID=A0ABZ0JZE1_9GAMM|nr:hypothetical protein RGE70_01535 [Shewanella sp. DAU334]